ncbi:MAG: hypothetical protein E6G06_13930 [Actinobacteria bacterium]|nr:MAG: hypothetical protein E6G06_13930 [Actinomycetota bacterium]
MSTVSGVDQLTVVDVLGPLRELPDWLVAAADPVRVANALVASVPELREGRLRVTAVDSGQARLKEDRWTIRYRVTLTDPDGGERTLRLLGTLVPPGHVQPDARPPSVPLGAAGWRCWLSRLGMPVEVEPPDDDLPALAVLVDPERSRALLEAAIAEQSPRHRDLRIATCEPRVARYSPGSRCTVLYRLGFDCVEGSSRGPDLVVAKTYHGDKGRVAWGGMRAVWDSPLSRGDPVHVAEPLAFLPELNVLIQGPVREEQTLKQLIVEAWRTHAAAARARLDTAVAQAAHGLAVLHGCGAAAEVTVTWEDELADVRQALGRLGNAIPALPPTVEPLLAELAARAAACPADPVGPAHRSFRPAQVLLCGADASVIDFDGFCHAEPALDVAMFRATVRDIALGELTDDVERASRDEALHARADEVDALCDAFLARYESHRPVSRARVALYETLDLLTVVLHSWTKVKPSRLRHGMVLLERHLRTPGTLRRPRARPGSRVRAGGNRAGPARASP